MSSVPAISRRLAIALAAVGVAGLGGCRSFASHRQELEADFALGRYDLAAATLDDPKVHELYGDRNELLWKLDRGSVAAAMGENDKAIELLNSAENQVERQREQSSGDVLAQWTVNDTKSKYIAEPYEDLYINVVKMLAQFQAGRIDGGATVEARRMAGKADALRDKWLKYEDAAVSKGGPAVAGAQGGLSQVNAKGEFLESPLGTFLTAVAFMKSGDREFQRVAGKRLVDSMKLQTGLIGPVRPDDFEGLDELDPSSVNVLVVALSGRGPTKYAERIGPIPLGTIPIYMELPQLRSVPSEAAGARLEIEGDAEKRPLRLVEDLNAVATENHRRAMPAMYARTLVRYTLKAGLSVAATEVARHGANDRYQGLVQIAGVLGGLAVLAATEEADLRSWIFLPGQARVGLVKLPPGHYRVRIVYEGASGGDVWTTAWQDIDVTDGLTSVVGRYWR